MLKIYLITIYFSLRTSQFIEFQVILDKNTTVILDS